MEPTKPKTTAKDFFLQLAVIVALYWATGSLMDLLYTVINVAFPQVNSYSYFGANSISFPVASLVVVFPLFLLLSWFIEKGYTENPEKKELGVRKWLTYLTLFAAGLILVGSLVFVIYLFLDGRELTAGFLLKVLAWLVVAGIIFGYYLQDIRNKIRGSQRKIWAGLSTLVILISVILGFVVIGSPRSQQLQRYDDQKISDLRNIQGQVVNYWQQKKKLPESLVNLKDSLSYNVVPVDSQTKAQFEYKVTGPTNFELCAVFNKDSQASSPVTRPVYGPQDNWAHTVGHYCFTRTIDSELYSPYNKNL